VSTNTTATVVRCTDCGEPAEWDAVVCTVCGADIMPAEATTEGTYDTAALSDQMALEQRRADQQPGIGLAAGLAASMVGAAAWAALTFVTGWQIGFMAIGIGLLVGFAVREGGKGVGPMYRYLGAGLSLAGCLFGNLLLGSAYIADAEDVSVLLVIMQLDATLAQFILVELFSPMDLFFYGLAAYAGYKSSVSEEADQTLQSS